MTKSMFEIRQLSVRGSNAKSYYELTSRDTIKHKRSGSVYRKPRGVIFEDWVAEWLARELHIKIQHYTVVVEGAHFKDNE